jgi:hypothetical protein
MDEQRQFEREVLRRMSPAEKLSVMTSLIRLAYRLRASWIRTRHPDLSEEEVRRQLRESMSGDRS